ncbi:transposase [Moraxella bovis]|uniref:transposase n=1 Tax=Moraxella bovis TaxID=476 RepID=UPI003CC8234C
MYKDESGFEARTYRPYGYAPIGQPSILYHNYQNSRLRVNVIGVLCHNQLFACLIINTTLTPKRFMIG